MPAINLDKPEPPFENLFRYLQYNINRSFIQIGGILGQENRNALTYVTTFAMKPGFLVFLRFVLHIKVFITSRLQKINVNLMLKIDL